MTRCPVCDGLISKPPIPEGAPRMHDDCWRWGSLHELGQTASADYVARQIQEKSPFKPYISKEQR